MKTDYILRLFDWISLFLFLFEKKCSSNKDLWFDSVLQYEKILFIVIENLNLSLLKLRYENVFLNMTSNVAKRVFEPTFCWIFYKRHKFVHYDVTLTSLFENFSSCEYDNYDVNITLFNHPKNKPFLVKNHRDSDILFET